MALVHECHVRNDKRLESVESLGWWFHVVSIRRIQSDGFIVIVHENVLCFVDWDPWTVPDGAWQRNLWTNWKMMACHAGPIPELGSLGIKCAVYAMRSQQKLVRVEAQNQCSTLVSSRPQCL